MSVKKPKKIPVWYYLLFFLIIIGVQMLFFSGPETTSISYDQFRDSLEAGRIKSVVIKEDKIEGFFKFRGDSLRTRKEQPDTLSELPDPAKLRQPARPEKGEKGQKFKVVRVNDETLIEDLEKHNVNYTAKKDSNWFWNLLIWLFPLLLIFYLFSAASRSMKKGKRNMFNFGRSGAKPFNKSDENKITFDDVAGVDEAKQELREMIEFLRHPGKFTKLGGKIPKGVILIGPPGTGKTLLARAVAGEASVPFYSLTGSEFVEMFVGVGAARVRDLFKEAKKNAPCIIFIDEIDAIGKSRSQSTQVGSNEERENTLHQLLAEMDGFSPGDNVIVIASTNRPEILDRALLRPGRFDRQVLLDRPDLKGREEILKVHARDLTLDPKLDLKEVAAQTPGFSGADLANICNEAALLASRKDKKNISLKDFQNAIERVIAGLEKKNRLINPKERKVVAYHESGHAIVGYFTPGADPVHKVSIIPRGIGSLGYTLQAPTEDRYLMSKSELTGKVKGLLGGRAAEETVFNEISTGGANDLERVTRIVREMVTVYGMSDKIPNISLKKQGQARFLGQEALVEKRSEKLEQTIDDEILRFINDCYKEAKELLNKKRDELEEMASQLLEKETLSQKDVENILK